MKHIATSRLRFGPIFCCVALMSGLLMSTHGQTIFRCTDPSGRVQYQAQACEGGQALSRADDSRSPTQQRQASQTSDTQRQLAERMARERSREERRQVARQGAPIELVVRDDPKKEKLEPERRPRKQTSRKKASEKASKKASLRKEASGDSERLSQDPPPQRPKEFRALVPAAP